MLGAGIKIKIPKMSYRYFSRHVSVEKLAQIVFLMYQYNFDAEKKNFKILADKMGIKQSTQTYIYSWLKNLPGLTGGFVKPQSTSLDSYQQELTKRIEEMEKEKEGKDE
jgi:flagellar capping protein FliD